MTPEKRLNQIETELADVVQKVDRIIEGNGQIIGEVSKIPGIGRKVLNIERETARISGIERETAKIPGVERTVSITAKGLNNLTTNVNKRFDQQQNQINDLRLEIKQQFTEVNQRFDQFQQDVTDVKSGQQLILQILREKLASQRYTRTNQPGIGTLHVQPCVAPILIA